MAVIAFRRVVQPTDAVLAPTHTAHMDVAVGLVIVVVIMKIARAIQLTNQL